MRIGELILSKAERNIDENRAAITSHILQQWARVNALIEYMIREREKQVNELMRNYENVKTKRGVRI